MKNALSEAPVTMDEKYEAAKRRNNYLKETPSESPKTEGWKFKVRPVGGLKPHGIKVSGKWEF